MTIALNCGRVFSTHAKMIQPTAAYQYSTIFIAGKKIRFPHFLYPATNDFSCIYLYLDINVCMEYGYTSEIFVAQIPFLAHAVWYNFSSDANIQMPGLRDSPTVYESKFCVC